jgi:hypothetical protein
MLNHALRLLYHIASADNMTLTIPEIEVIEGFPMSKAGQRCYRRTTYVWEIETKIGIEIARVQNGREVVAYTLKPTEAQEIPLKSWLTDVERADVARQSMPALNMGSSEKRRTIALESKRATPTTARVRSLKGSVKVVRTTGHETIRRYLFYGYRRKDTGKIVYVGLDVTGQRVKEHEKRLRDGSDACRLLKEAYDREPDAFECVVLDQKNFTRADALNHEKHLIAIHQTLFPSPGGCNLMGYTREYDAGRADAIERTIERKKKRAEDKARAKSIPPTDYQKRRRAQAEARRRRGDRGEQPAD